MSEYGVETRSVVPKNIFAGDFDTLTDSSTADAAIAEYAPVVKTETGVTTATAETLANLVGIAAASAGTGEPVVYYMTGEFHTDAISLPSGITADALKDACRKLSIFLR